MKPIQLESQIGADGTLNLVVPIGSKEANRRVMVTIEQLPYRAFETAVEHDRCESLYGSCAGLGLQEPPDLPLPPIE